MRGRYGVALLVLATLTGAPLSARGDEYSANFGFAGSILATGNRMTVSYFGWESTTYYGHTIWAMTTQDYQDNLGNNCFSTELNPAGCDTRKGVPLFSKPTGQNAFDPNSFSGPRTMSVDNYFTQQTEVIFVLQVNQTSMNNWFFSGDPTRNGDQLAHLGVFDPNGVPVNPGEGPVVPGTPGHALYGFEDVHYGSSDWDFNNALFSLAFEQAPGDVPTEEAPTPEPATLTLLATGLAGLFAHRRRTRDRRAA